MRISMQINPVSFVKRGVSEGNSNYSMLCKDDTVVLFSSIKFLSSYYLLVKGGYTGTILLLPSRQINLPD
jgi:hypothetical protein